MLRDLVHPRRFPKDRFSLIDDFPADAGGNDRLFGPVENLDGQLLFQFADHHRQRGLGYMAMFGCLHEMPVIIDCDNVFQLLNIHLLSINLCKKSTAT